MDLVVGRVVKAHGVTGEVVVEIRTDDPESRRGHRQSRYRRASQRRRRKA